MQTIDTDAAFHFVYLNLFQMIKILYFTHIVTHILHNNSLQVLMKGVKDFIK